MDYGVKLADVELEHPLLSGPGTCKTLEDVKSFARSAVSAVTAGSITLQDRPFNPGNTFWNGPDFALNSLGMPNPGRDYYSEHLPEMVELCHNNGKAFILNVAGFSPEEYGELALMAFQGGADFIELNLGCPNVWDEGKQKRIASFDSSAIYSIFGSVAQRVPVDRARIGVKLSPYSDPAMIEEVAIVLGELPVSYIATANTFPNSFAMDFEGKPLIGVGYAGLSGEAMKPIGLGQVRQFREQLNGAIPVVGLGGVLTGRDVVDYLHSEVGATAVAATTAYWRSNENPNIYGEILAQYHDELEEA